MSIDNISTVGRGGINVFMGYFLVNIFDPVTPGAVWSPSMPAPAVRPGPKTAVLPGWTGVS